MSVSDGLPFGRVVNFLRVDNFVSVFGGYLQIENKSRKGMCTVNIKDDEATIRRVNPSLTTTESVGQWV